MARIEHKCVDFCSGNTHVDLVHCAFTGDGALALIESLYEQHYPGLMVVEVERIPEWDSQEPGADWRRIPLNGDGLAPTPYAFIVRWLAVGGES